MPVHHNPVRILSDSACENLSRKNQCLVHFLGIFNLTMAICIASRSSWGGCGPANGKTIVAAYCSPVKAKMQVRKARNDKRQDGAGNMISAGGRRNGAGLMIESVLIRAIRVKMNLRVLCALFVAFELTIGE